MTGHAVVIAGGGPTGLMLAGELALAGVDVAVVERRASQQLDGSRSGGLHARTIEVLDQRGIADRFLAEGQAMQIAGFAGIPLDISDFPTRHNYGLALWQSHFERILAAWVGELGVPIVREREVTGFAQDGTGVDVELSDGQSLRADYLVGCDGGRSLIRKAAGIEFPGWDPSLSSLIAEVEMSEEPQWGIRYGDNGTQALGRLEDGKRVRVVVSERYAGHTGEPTLRDLSQALIDAWGTDYGVHSPTWISRFTDMTRQAASYRKGRVFLAGDAAHVHYPVGGQGLNTGVQDAMNLGWKLAQVVSGTPEDLLDTYHAERHPVGARVLQNTMAQTALTRSDARIDALRDTMSAELLSMDEPRKRIAAMIAGLDIHYDLGEGHALLGRRMPDLDLVTADGPLRVFTLLHQARPVLLNLGEPGSADITPWADRVQLTDAKYAGVWELPVLGAVTAPAAVLIRPDGYVAWAGDPTHPGLSDALTNWFGPPTTAWREAVVAADPRLPRQSAWIVPYERPLPAELVKFLDTGPPASKTIPEGQEPMHSLHFTAETLSNSLVERDFAVREITGALWSPASGTDRAPLVPMGHGGGQHRKSTGNGRARAPHCDQLRFHRRGCRGRRADPRWLSDL